MGKRKRFKCLLSEPPGKQGEPEVRAIPLKLSLNSFSQIAHVPTTTTILAMRLLALEEIKKFDYPIWTILRFSNSPPLHRCRLCKI